MTRRHRGSGAHDRGHAKPDTGSIWVWGTHSVKAALANPRRRCLKFVLGPGGDQALRAVAAARKIQIEAVDAATIGRILPRDAVHQGVGLLVAPLEDVDIHDALEGAVSPRRFVLVDQVTDPHNLGAILRSAAAFGACGVIVQDRHSPPEGGVLAKTASGALDVVPLVRVVNIARTLDELAELGFLRVAFADEAAEPIERVDLDRDVVLALGAEGEGLRRLTREKCDVAVRLPTRPEMPSLNVSNAAAVALYACAIAVKR